MINATAQVKCLVRGDAVLGEGPVWDPREGALYWVDIERPAIFRWSEATGSLDRWMPPFQIASLAPAGTCGFIAGTRRGFAWVDPAAGRYEPIVHPEADVPGNRFNDGKLDRAGRFWAGTMDDGEQSDTGVLYRLDHDLTAKRIDTGYHITNGPAFDRAGRHLYHSDTGRRTIFAFDLDNAGKVDGKRAFLQFAPNDGHPDGMTVDEEDCLWVAFWGGACVRRFAPDATLLAEIAVPAPQVTSCTFGGGDMATLFITTARRGLDPAQHPLAGSVFSVQPGVAGISDTAFAGCQP